MLRLGHCKTRNTETDNFDLSVRRGRGESKSLLLIRKLGMAWKDKRIAGGLKQLNHGAALETILKAACNLHFCGQAHRSSFQL